LKKYKFRKRSIVITVYWNLMMNKYAVVIGAAAFCVALTILVASGPHGSAGRLLVIGIPIFTVVILRVAKNGRRL